MTRAAKFETDLDKHMQELHIRNCYLTAGYTQKDMIDFMPGHKRSDSLILIGLCPSSATKPTKNSSFVRVNGWMHGAGITEWDLCNIVPHIEDVDTSIISKVIRYDLLKERVSPFKKVIALGNHAAAAMTKIGIPHQKLYHPSFKNRSLNKIGDYDPNDTMIELIRKYVNED